MYISVNISFKQFLNEIKIVNGPPTCLNIFQKLRQIKYYKSAVFNYFLKPQGSTQNGFIPLSQCNHSLQNKLLILNLKC